MNSSRKGKDKLAVVFDIGSGSVGGALVRFSKKPFDSAQGKPEILYTVRQPITLAPDLDFNVFLSETARSLEKVANSLDRVALGAPTEVHCFLASPWYAAQTRTMTLSRNTPFTLTSKIITELACREVKNFELNNIERYQDLGENIRILEQEIMQIKLNGYKTINPFGRKTKDLEVAMYISLSPEKVLRELEYRIQKFFNYEIKFHSFPFATFVVTRDLFPAESGFLFVDIAGEITDLAKVSDDVLEESISFPYGKNFFIRSLSRGLNKDISESSSLLDLYLSGHAEKKTSGQVEQSLADPRGDWLRAFQDSLSEVSSRQPLPERIFLTVDADVAVLFKSLIDQEQLHQYTVTQGRFNVTILEPRVFQPYCHAGNNAEYDPFLIIESIFINRI